jgi:hypothetical protein
MLIIIHQGRIWRLNRTRIFQILLNRKVNESESSVTHESNHLSRSWLGVAPDENSFFISMFQHSLRNPPQDPSLQPAVEIDTAVG